MNKRRGSGRINEEYVCVDSFVQHLREIDSRQEITANEERNDPPDFWITITGVKYAVEVTSIVTDYGYDALYKKLVKTIRSESKRNDDIKGTYALTIVRRPEIPKRGTTHWRMLVSTAATKIREMSKAPSEAEACLLKDTNGYLVIEKLSNEGSKIGLCRMPAMKREGEIQDELSQLIKERIEAKRERLTNVLSGGSSVILLFYDAFDYADIKDIQKAFLDVQGYEWVHSIFMAMSFSDIPNTLYPDSPGRKGSFLYSKNKQWH